MREVEAHKMTESQNIEWKESWRDEYLKWYCKSILSRRIY